MVGLKGIDIDSDGDVIMGYIHDYIRAPRLKIWNQPAIVCFLKERETYEGHISERCGITGEDKRSIQVTV